MDLPNARNAGPACRRRRAGGVLGESPSPLDEEALLTMHRLGPSYRGCARLREAALGPSSRPCRGWARPGLPSSAGRREARREGFQVTKESGTRTNANVRGAAEAAAARRDQARHGTAARTPARGAFPFRTAQPSKTNIQTMRAKMELDAFAVRANHDTTAAAHRARHTKGGGPGALARSCAAPQ